MKKGKRVFRWFLLGILVLGLNAGCAASHNSLSSHSEIMIVSFPSGAVIEVDGKYIGKAPLFLDLSVYKEVNHDRLKELLILAHPAQEGYCRQAIKVNLSAAPEILKFDMSLCP